VLFKTLACDFDGTLASEDRLHPDAAAALTRAREAGLRLLLVTGRTFFELVRVCERLDLFDAVVAENGAVIYFPGSAMIRDQGPPPPNRLAAELDRRGISYQVGRVIMATARGDEHEVREALRAARVSRDLIYNRASLMLLPPGVSKGNGVERALEMMGLSFHDVLGIGDAENDLDLFRACGWSGCPGDAVESIRQQADWVFPGHDGQAIGAAIAGPILGGALPVHRSPRHRIGIGWVVETSELVAIPARGVNVLISGDPLSGKSWLTGALVERLVEARYAVCVLDPEGDYRVLAHQPGARWVEIHDETAMVRALARFEHEPSACLLADLSLVSRERKPSIVGAALGAIRELRRRRGLPHWVVVDEAHDPLQPGGVRDDAAGIEDKGFCLATYRPSWLRPSVMDAMDVFIVGRTTAPEQAAAVTARLGPDLAPGAIGVLPQLPIGEFLVVEPEQGGGWTPLTFVAPPRQTAHVRHHKKYADTSVPRERRFIFRRPDGEVVGEADSLHGFRRAVLAVDDATLGHHVGRGDFSRWVLDIFSDRELARQFRKLEARRRRGEVSELRAVIDRLITLRYGPEP
jgi:hydroxymethylpyrimidine pyrophosphatase-like HAD family hydrolase